LVSSDPRHLAVAFRGEVGIPGFDESAHNGFDILAFRAEHCAGKFDPRRDLRASAGMWVEEHPLFHGVAEYVIDPGYAARMIADRDDAVLRGFDGVSEFDL